MTWTRRFAFVLALAAAQSDDEGRYTSYSIRIRGDTPIGSDSPASELDDLNRFGKFVEMPAGETLELSALQLGYSPEHLRLLNRCVQGDFTSPYLCVSFGHRRLPDEDLASIAKLYETEVAVLRELNDLGESEEPRAWAKLEIPVPLAEMVSGYVLTLPVPRWSVLASGRDALRFKHHFRHHVVAESDTWESLAKDAGSTAAFLRSIHRERPRVIREAGRVVRIEQTPVDPLVVGTRVRVGARLDLSPMPTLANLVLYLEHFLRVDFDSVLQLNELDAPEDALLLDQLEIPFSASGGFHGLNLTGAGISARERPGTSPVLHVSRVNGEVEVVIEVRGQ